MGHLRPGIEVSQTEPESVFTLGYEVNGQRGLYPPGILIGTVSRAFSEPGSVESSVTIRPAVDFSTLQYVLVIARDRPRPGGAPVRRTAVLVAVIVTALLLQTAVFPKLTMLGVKPELLYLVTVVFAVLQGPGRRRDRRLRERASRRTSCSTCRRGSRRSRSRCWATPSASHGNTSPRPRPCCPPSSWLSGRPAASPSIRRWPSSSERRKVPFSYAAKVILLTAIYGAVLTPIFFPVLRRAAAAAQAGRVVRF